MRAKKTVFLTALTLMLLLGLVAAGTALAAPAGLDVHSPTHVAGAIVPVSEVPGSRTIDFVTGNTVSIGNVVTYAFHGDLEGTFVETTNDNGNINTGLYTFVGQVTFDGTLNGKKTHWVGAIAGDGFLDPSQGYTAGHEAGTISVTSSASPLSHLRGTIHAYGSWTPTSGSATYWGDLTWQSGKKN